MATFHFILAEPGIPQSQVSVPDVAEWLDTTRGQQRVRNEQQVGDFCTEEL